VGCLRFYRHVLWFAIRPSLAIADVTFYGALVALAVAAILWPGSPELLGIPERQMTLYVFGLVIIARLLMAPYWVYREVAALVPSDAGVSADWTIKEALDYIVNDSTAELKQPAPSGIPTLKGGVSSFSGVQHGHARVKINEGLISGELKAWGFRKLDIHTVNRFEEYQREILKEYWNDMQLDFINSLNDTDYQPQTVRIPGHTELPHMTGIRVSSVQVRRKWPPKSAWRQRLNRLARKPRIMARAA
jgi:hypothetical protein